jgi:hypothetical protein
VAHAGQLASLDLSGWERMLARGRRHALAGRWHRLLAAAGRLDAVPDAVRRHLWSEHLLAEDRNRMVRWEANRLDLAFSDSGISVILLKGAAYILCGLRCGEGRLLSDVDILVPFAQLADAEAVLHRHGWRSLPHADYDDRYYREWMHELPPLQHGDRGALLDVHHNLLPRTSPLCPDASLLWPPSRALPGSRLRVLAPADMTLHSIVHGFFGGEFTNGWRDVLDVHELVTDFASADAGFWDALEARTRELHFARPAWYALDTAARTLGTQVPRALLGRLARYAGGGAGAALVRAAIRHTLLPGLPPRFSERAALRLLYLRSHWVKMPLPLLVRHLWTKFRMRRTI